MRVTMSILAFAGLAVCLSGQARAEDEFMTQCLVTGSRQMCECMSANVPADQRSAAVAGMRKSNAAVSPGALMADPSKMSQEEMRGLRAEGKIGGIGLSTHQRKFAGELAAQGAAP